MSDSESSITSIDSSIDENHVVDVGESCKTQVVSEHYIKKFQVFDSKKYDWVSYDPTSVPPPPPPVKNPSQYFTILQRYKTVGAGYVFGIILMQPLTRL